eukprot:Pompholyxophrys_punicea_v1_NODE_1162_length_898_cov_12.164692.p1 type:complete len:200 gc:universal NODE_1162_length_898_cov_12.164692:897-298(-)
MVDGKTFNLLANTKSKAVCGVCQLKPSDMNNIKKVLSQKTDSQYIKHGISNLHCYIRCLEYVLNVSIRMKIGWKKWRIPKEKKPEAKIAETEIRNSLRDKLAIIVNVVKQAMEQRMMATRVADFFQIRKLRQLELDLMKNSLHGCRHFNFGKWSSTHQHGKFQKILSGNIPKTHTIVPLVLFARRCAPTPSSFVGGFRG